MSVDSDFSGDEKREVSEFADAEEYGLALETFVDIIFEENKNLPNYP